MKQYKLISRCKVKHIFAVFFFYCYIRNVNIRNFPKSVYNYIVYLIAALTDTRSYSGNYILRSAAEFLNHFAHRYRAYLLYRTAPPGM